MNAHPGTQKYVPAPDESRKVAASLADVGFPFLGAALGLWIGDATAPPDPTGAMLEFRALGWMIDGALIGFLAGLVLGGLVAWAIWARRPNRR